MRREAVILAGVLVPFAVLLALWLASQPPEPPEPEPERAQAIVPATEAHPAEPASLLPPADSGAPVVQNTEAALTPMPIRAAIERVSPQIHTCFVDNGAHLHGRTSVTAHFVLTREGGFSDVTLTPRLADPRLEACLEDVFEEMRFTLSGHETFEPASHTFIFDAPPL